MARTVELVWAGKGERPASSSAALVEVSHHGEPSENLVIHGDNLPALRALLGTLRGAVQCVYIDPPYNTGSARVPYPDAEEHAAWLSFLTERLALLRELLAPSGSLFVHLDDNELDYLKVALDELFGREQFIGRITVSARAPSAFSTVNRGVFKAAEYLLWFARDRAAMKAHALRVPRPRDPAYTLWLENPDDPHEAWQIGPVREAFERHTGQRWRTAGRAAQDTFVLRHARQVLRLAQISEVAAGKATVELKHRSCATPGQVLRLDRGPELDPIYALDGQQLVSYARNVVWIDGAPTASAPLTNIWTDIAWEGIAGEGGVQLKRGKKPEQLLRRVLELVTDPGDRVLDAFAGSGTTGAVAHKLGRPYVLIELEPRCLTHVVPRLQAVVDGVDPGGITLSVGWQGGGGFRLLRAEG